MLKVLFRTLFSCILKASVFVITIVSMATSQHSEMRDSGVTENGNNVLT